MTLRKLLLAAFSLLLVAACLAMPFLPQSVQPFNASSAPSSFAMEVLPSSVGLPMPDGLQAGDLLYFSDMTPETRSFFMVGSLNPPAGTVIELSVRRPDGLHHLQAHFLPVAFLSGDTSNVLNQLAGYALLLLEAALGLLLSWRGRNRAAWGVALWCLTGVLQNLVAGMPIPMPYGKFLSWAGTILANIGTMTGLYIVADDLTASAHSPQHRKSMHAVFALIMTVYCAMVIFYNWNFYFTGTNVSWGIETVVGLHFAALVLPLCMMALSYRRAAAIDQARIRWVIFSLGGLLAIYMFQLVAVRLGISFFILSFVGTVLTAATFTGFAYAVLKHRLASLEVVLNRALVYGLITSLVVGVFAAMLSFLERNTIHSETNQFLALIVPLILGMGLNALKRQVDERINKVFFRNKHKAEAEAALTQFARTCAFIDAPERLLDLTAGEFHQHSGAQSLGIYLTQPGGSAAKLARQRGASAYPKRLDANDPALLQLRAGDTEVDLHGISSVLGTDGYAYALAVRGEVLGVLVCGPRPSETYTAEERRLFALVAHQVAITLHALRLQEQEQLLRDLADGAFKSLTTARTRAKALLMPKAAG